MLERIAAARYGLARFVARFAVHCCDGFPTPSTSYPSRTPSSCSPCFTPSAPHATSKEEAEQFSHAAADQHRHPGTRGLEIVRQQYPGFSCLPFCGYPAQWSVVPFQLSGFSVSAFVSGLAFPFLLSAFSISAFRQSPPFVAAKCHLEEPTPAWPAATPGIPTKCVWCASAACHPNWWSPGPRYRHRRQRNSPPSGGATSSCLAWARVRLRLLAANLRPDCVPLLPKRHPPGRRPPMKTAVLIRRTGMQNAEAVWRW